MGQLCSSLCDIFCSIFYQNLFGTVVRISDIHALLVFCGYYTALMSPLLPIVL